VARSGLTARLDGDYRVALVSAPAGYGKTATLASWAAQRADEVAWLSCDPMDAEPTRFMSCLLTAISTRWPGVADDAFVLLERQGSDTYDSAVAVANDLATVGERGTIVVDDLYLAAPAPTMLTAFIDALPEGFRLVAGTRSDPPLSLARWRLRGGLLELRGNDLRFAPHELSEFLKLQDVVVDLAELERLYELTEGWPAGAQLAAIALQRGGGREDFLAAFAGTDRTVADFLLSEVVASLPPDLVDFLMESSVLDAFDAELCAAVTGREKTAALLDGLIAANLFLVELDDPPRWFRYHHLFGAFLRARLASLGASRLQSANGRAARALEARGHMDAALRHAMAAGEVDRVGQILRGAIARSMSMSDGAADTVRAVRVWLHERGAAAVETDPAWVLEMLMALITISRPDDAQSWLERVRRAHPDADGPLTALIEGVWSEHWAVRGQPFEALRCLGLAVDAVGGTPPNVGMLPLLFTATARAHIQSAQMDQARAVLQHAHAHPVGHPVIDEVRNRGLAAFVAANDGELVEAAALVRDVEESAGLLGLERFELGRVYAGLAMVAVCVERNELENARQLVEGISADVALTNRLTVQVDLTLQQAKLARSLGDVASAEAFLTQARLAYDEPDAGVRQVFGEEAVAQALRFDPARAASLIAELDPDRVATQVLMARRALSTHDHREAARLLADLPPPSNRRARVERAVLCALSVLDHDVEDANHHLGAALIDAQPVRLVRSIVDAGPGVQKLLASFPPNADQEVFVEALLAAADRSEASLRTKVEQALVDPLSTREVTVLRYLCSRLTYQEIAAALFVSVNTLKSHVRAVYRKLGVASRTEAVDTGRRLGLI
jgi:ATP/maltotriose-dependent transcriptional regulator MalT